MSAIDLKTRLSKGIELKVLLILFLISWICYFFKVESNLGIPELFLITTVGFIVQSFVSMKHRAILLFLICIGSVSLFLEPINALVFYGFALILFAISLLKLARRTRYVLVVLFAALIIFLRSKALIPFLDDRLWVILASMFMFRIIVFIQQHDPQKDETPILDKLNYFLLFPNVFSPLFPIVDYKLYSKPLDEKKLSSTQMKGINLIALGVLQLLIYRVIYSYFVPTVSEITSLMGLSKYIVFNYLLVFRLLGLFNISVGILRIFGYSLPEIFNSIFISSSLSDFFRRLNIYWRDFLLNTFYYPIYFRFKKSGLITALAISSVITFVLNWFFHAYQWFWILGTSPIRWTDTLFWGLFSFIVVIEMIYQAKYPKRSRSAKTEAFTWPLKVIITFLFIAVIWSLWTSASVPFWIQMMKNGAVWDMESAVKILAVVLGIYVLAVLYKLYVADMIKSINKSKDRLLYNFNVSVLFLIAILSCNWLVGKLDPQLNDQVADFAEPKKNAYDLEKEAEGYYNEILEFNIGSANWSQVAKDEHADDHKPAVSSLNELRYETDDLRLGGFIPNREVVRGDFHFETNSLGLRDKEYSLEPDPSVIRMAFLGGSPESGYHLSNDKIIESLTEAKLNEHFPEDKPKFEILNFSYNGYNAPHYRAVMQMEIPKFKPQYALFSVRTRDLFYAYKKLELSYIRRNKKLDQDFLDFLEENNIEFYNPMPRQQAKAFGRKIWLWCYQEIKEVCEREGITPIFVFIPEISINSQSYEHEHQELLDLNEQELGFDLIDLNGIYEGYDRDELNVNQNENGNHPNAKGHKLVADNLYPKLAEYFNLDK